VVFQRSSLNHNVQDDGGSGEFQHAEGMRLREAAEEEERRRAAGEDVTAWLLPVHGLDAAGEGRRPEIMV